MTMTYTSLLSQVQLTFERSDDPFTSQIPNFISQAHERIARDCISLEMVSHVNASLSIGSNRITKPANWLRPLSLKIIIPGATNLYQVVEWRSYEFCRSYFPADSNIAAQGGTTPIVSPVPLFYSDYDRNTLHLSPTSAVAYNYELSYYCIVYTITDTNSTNFLTQYAPYALLYATLLEASSFIKEDERIPVWQQLYEKAIEGLNNIDKENKEDRQTNRDRE